MRGALGNAGKPRKVKKLQRVIRGTSAGEKPSVLSKSEDEPGEDSWGEERAVQLGAESR